MDITKQTRDLESGVHHKTDRGHGVIRTSQNRWGTWNQMDVTKGTGDLESGGPEA